MTCFLLDVTIRRLEVDYFTGMSALELHSGWHTQRDPFLTITSFLSLQTDFAHATQIPRPKLLYGVMVIQIEKRCR
jgi:hypothetical protein